MRRHPPYRPRWWPPEEPWPPDGLPGERAGRAMRRGFMRHIALLLLWLFLLALAGVFGLAWLLSRLFAGPVSASLPEPLAIGVVLLVIVGVAGAGRWVRRSAWPMGDLMEAAGRVAEGDYSARVAERGPRDMRVLARTFNHMIVRIQAGDVQRRSQLAEVTHELRTPLTVIEANLEALLDGVYPRDDAHLAPVLEETRLLSRLIDDLRTLSLAESGALQLRRESVEMADLVDEAISPFRAQAAGAGVALSAEVQPGLVADLDPARIHQVLANLIANALRYTPAGGIIRVRCAGEGDKIAVTVQDTGVGISAEELPHIFDRFHKSGDSSGSGLGLAIVRNLVAAHGGEIAAESDPGVGTTVSFTIPRDGKEDR